MLLTAFVRLVLLPLSLSAARGQRARARLAPQVAELRKKYGRDPERLQRIVMELYAREKVSPFAGCLPVALQLPVFFLLYRLFSGGGIGEHSLFGAPLGGSWGDALAGGAWPVYVGLFLVAGGVAAYTYWSSRRQMGALELGGDVPGMGAMVRVMPLLSFGTLVTVAVVPLAAALYVVTSTTWSAVERAVLYRSAAGPVREQGLAE